MATSLLIRHKSVQAVFPAPKQRSGLKHLDA